PLAPKRTFRPKVTSFEPPARMVWQEGNPMFRGVRSFTLSPKADGTTTISMTEVYTGLMLPLIAGSLPCLAPALEAYARDLQRAAEAARWGSARVVSVSVSTRLGGAGEAVLEEVLLAQPIQLRLHGGVVLALAPGDEIGPGERHRLRLPEADQVVDLGH